jgi:hypothetical protein
MLLGEAGVRFQQSDLGLLRRLIEATKSLIISNLSNLYQSTINVYAIGYVDRCVDQFQICLLVSQAIVSFVFGMRDDV